eukprot:TRINITY_DN9281_c0_g1_i1.p1 TRINITY_DN9281_c0_g1~~TRINITY_DN9281_c0_g1_i1.p1  ORF type:complete len:292 (-),score=59.54 TRINITY_DN9281_c0_g1_i1:54-893(-)
MNTEELRARTVKLTDDFVGMVNEVLDYTDTRKIFKDIKKQVSKVNEEVDDFVYGAQYCPIGQEIRETASSRSSSSSSSSSRAKVYPEQDLQVTEPRKSEVKQTSIKEEPVTSLLSFDFEKGLPSSASLPPTGKAAPSVVPSNNFDFLFDSTSSSSTTSLPPSNIIAPGSNLSSQQYFTPFITSTHAPQPQFQHSNHGTGFPNQNMTIHHTPGIQNQYTGYGQPSHNPSLSGLQSTFNGTPSQRLNNFLPSNAIKKPTIVSDSSQPKDDFDSFFSTRKAT